MYSSSFCGCCCSTSFVVALDVASCENGRLEQHGSIDPIFDVDLNVPGFVSSGDDSNDNGDDNLLFE